VLIICDSCYFVCFTRTPLCCH